MGSTVKTEDPKQTKTETVEVKDNKKTATVDPQQTPEVPDVDGTPDFKAGDASPVASEDETVLEVTPQAQVSAEALEAAPHAFHQTLTSPQSLSGQPPNLADNAPFQVLDPK